MPSDPSGVNPKGVLTRGAADFFDDSMATGGYWFHDTTVGHDSYITISLYNESNLGISLKVYGITVGNDSAIGTFMYARQGPPLGSFITQCRNIRFDLGAPFGQIWALQNQGVSPFPNPNPIPLGVTPIGNSGFSGISYFSPFPIAIVPPGYSLVVVNTQDTAIVFAGFWYQQANE